MHGLASLVSLGRHPAYMLLSSDTHKACGTSHQIKGLIAVTDNDATKAPGYDGLSTEAQEQVRLVFENEKVLNKDFKGIREDLELTDATGYDSSSYCGLDDLTDLLPYYRYKSDVGKRVCGCRNDACPEPESKIVKGELRLGIAQSYDGDHGE